MDAQVPRNAGCARAVKENYRNYYEAILPRFKTGGLLAADNTLWSGKVLDPKDKSDHAIVAFNTHICNDPRVSHALLSIRDGIMLVRKGQAESALQ